MVLISLYQILGFVITHHRGGIHEVSFSRSTVHPLHFYSIVLGLSPVCPCIWLGDLPPSCLYTLSLWSAGGTVVFHRIEICSPLQQYSCFLLNPKADHTFLCTPVSLRIVFNTQVMSELLGMSGMTNYCVSLVFADTKTMI